MTDRGFTHVALPVSNLDASLAFYATYAGLHPVHQRSDHGDRVAWLADGLRPFVLVLITTGPVSHPLLPIAHLGVACASRAEVDAQCAQARAAGVSVDGPHDHGPPVGYYALLSDPDGHTLELSHGQEVGLAVGGAPPGVPADPADTHRPGDLHSRKAIVAKGALFVVLTLGAVTLLLVESPTWPTAVALGIALWAACRSYYFAFHVLEHWIDPGFRYRGLIDLAGYALRRRR